MERWGVDGEAELPSGKGRVGSVSRLCQPNAFFFPVGRQPHLEDNFPQDNPEDNFPQDNPEDNFPQDNAEDLKVQILKEPSQLDQPVAGDKGGPDVSQEPNTEKDIDPGKLCRFFSMK